MTKHNKLSACLILSGFLFWGLAVWRIEATPQAGDVWIERNEGNKTYFVNTVISNNGGWIIYSCTEAEWADPSNTEDMGIRGADAWWFKIGSYLKSRK